MSDIERMSNSREDLNASPDGAAESPSLPASANPVDGVAAVPPIVSVDESAIQATISNADGESTVPEVPSTEPNPEATVDTLAVHTTPSGSDSMVQPGRPIFNREVPPEIGGTLERIGDRLDGGLHADVYMGKWVTPEGKEVKVAMKCIRMLNAVDKPRFKTLRGAGCGVAYLHSFNPVIVHGDIKPENVVIQDNLEAALCDFGVSRVIVSFEKGSKSELTTTGNKVGGTAGYISREILEDTSPEPSGDVFSFGGLILAALSGKDPFWKKKNEATKIAAVCKGFHPSPEDHTQLPADDPLWGLMVECWNQVPTSRPTMNKVLDQR
ncbi:hypothetical protein FRB90_006580 [Tulasnella sp. 427]|nr:hypothetical protein FRB90_006580 [Tulasnella sp. 427]